MKRSTCAVLFCISDLVSLIAFLWLFASKISIGVAEHLPGKNIVSYTMVAFAIVLAGGWRRSVRPRGNAHRGLSMSTAKLIRRLSELAMLIALSRFVLPLMTTRLGTFSHKPDF